VRRWPHRVDPYQAERDALSGPEPPERALGRRQAPAQAAIDVDDLGMVAEVEAPRVISAKTSRGR